MKTKDVIMFLAAVLMLLGTSALAQGQNSENEQTGNDFLKLSLGHYESDFKMAVDLNYYRNFLNLENGDQLNALTLERVAAGENSFKLYRFDQDYPNVLTCAAQLTLTCASTFSGVLYNIEYENQEPLAGFNYTITTSGSLNVDENNVIDLSPVTFVDQFTAFTGENEHPGSYGYVLIQNVVDNPKCSNTVEVPVLKADSDINGFYSLNDVMDDTDGTLQTGVKNAKFQMYLENNPAIYYYSIQRGDNTIPDEFVSRLQRRTDGSFMEMNDYFGCAGNIYEAGMYSMLEDDILTGSYDDYVSYLPIIWTFGNNRVLQDGENSYGSPILKTGVADVGLDVVGRKSRPWNDEAGELCCIYNPTIVVSAMIPEDASVNYEPYMYRLWRVCDDIRGYTLDPVTGMPVNDESVDRTPRQLIAEVVTDNASIHLGGAYSEYAFGAKYDTDIKFVARLYYKKEEIPLRASNEWSPLYYVVEKTVSWEIIHTGVTDINASTEVSKTYINPQGQMSDTPFDGINIVITRYSDGNTKTTKVVR